jgi:hypothetical protein
MLARRSHYRCTACFRDGLTPAALVAAARAHQRVVIDPAFTAATLAVSS